MKTILLTLPDFSIGGAEKMVLELIKNIDKSKYNLFLLIIREKKENNLEYEAKQHANIIYLNKKKGLNLLTFLKAYSKINEIKPDIIHSHLQSFLYVILYLLTHKIKLIHTVHNIPTEESKGLHRMILKFLLRIKKAVPIGISDTITSEIRKLYKIQNVHTIYNPVDLNRFYRTKSTKTKDNINLISVGRMVEQKNQKFLIDVFVQLEKEIPNVKLTLIGNGPLHNEISHYLKEVNCRSKIEIIKHTDNVNYYLNQADIFLLTSTFEGLPMTILEAMAVGLPIISSNVGGIKDIINKNGILIDGFILEDYILAIKKVILDDKLKQSMSHYSLKQIEEYSIDNISKKYENVYDKYMKN